MDRPTDRQTDRWTDICDSRVAFTTEKIVNLYFKVMGIHLLHWLAGFDGYHPSKYWYADLSP